MRNKERLDQYLVRIRSIAHSVREEIEIQLGALNEISGPDDRAAWLEVVTESLFEDEEFARLSLDIMEDIHYRFGVIEEGEFEYGSTGWPTLWFYEHENRDEFLKAGEMVL